MSKTIIITGASTGIGRDMALQYAQQGYHVGLIARRLDLLENLRDDIKTVSPGSKVVLANCDVADFTQAQQIVRQMITELDNRIDIFIANAGIGIPTPAFKNNWAEIKRTLDINVYGAIATIEAAKEVMLAQKSGHLVGITSVAAMRGLPGSSAYCTSKIALSTYLESIRIDLKPYGISVTAIHPGFIDTPMTKKNKFHMPFLLTSPESAQKIIKAISRGKKRYYFPWPMALLYKMVRILPDCWSDFFLGLAAPKIKR
ncbi:SDR family NAD(P)-dependent oxidoreductase [bacterium]|nr:SDR family NAD(P)-dependent oxidoreductase [bacterium]